METSFYVKEHMEDKKEMEEKEEKHLPWEERRWREACHGCIFKVGTR